MKSASSSSNDIHPAVEIARAIGAMPLSLMGTALIRSASFPGDSDDSDTPDAIAVSCNRPMPTGESCAALRSQLEKDCLPRNADSRAVRSFSLRSGRRAMRSVACPALRTASRKSAASA